MAGLTISRLTTALTHQAAVGEGPAQIADAIISTWHEIDAALAPIVGNAGFAALYGRTLHLTTQTYPWLANAYELFPTAIDFEALKSQLAQQSSLDVAAAGGAFLHTFYQLLAGLIGAALAEQLLHPVLTNRLRTDAAQDLLL